MSRSPTSGPRMLRADPAWRKRLAVLGFVLVLVLFLGVLRLQAFLDQVVSRGAADPVAAVETLRHTGRVVFGSMILGAWALALVVGRLSIRALRCAEFPPPGTWVVRDTEILEGPAARRRAAFGIALAIGLVVLGALVPWRGFQVFETFLAVVLERAARG